MNGWAVAAIIIALVLLSWRVEWLEIAERDRPPRNDEYVPRL